MKMFPGADFFYKVVAKLNNRFYSIYDSHCEYKVGHIKYEEVKPNKQGGYFVYKDVKNAIFADIAYKEGGNFLAPRSIIKVICWGEPLSYGNKLCYPFILPVLDLGLPMGYKSNPKQCIQLT
mmetsp:Transcript_19155/g.32658  ORF Transcript_19155/g.32658 Transcript_19155/m.32658 type:complete len:122 (+) Transcript_19155:258-623(+)